MKGHEISAIYFTARHCHEEVSSMCFTKSEVSGQIRFGKKYVFLNKVSANTRGLLRAAQTDSRLFL